jgi:hypothetical protein
VLIDLVYRVYRTTFLRGKGSAEICIQPSMPKRSNRQAAQPQTLKGWQQIATFLGEPTSVVQRWASEGMPLRRQGRFVTTTAEELNAWL